MPLSSLPPGSTAKVVSVVGGRGIRWRLYEVGLTPGAVVRVVTSTRGPVIVEVRGQRIALGRGVAAKVLVVPLEGEE